VASALTLGLLTCLPVAVRSARGASFARLAMAGEPVAPDQCTASLIGVFGGNVLVVQWRDNSDNEDGFTVEWWANLKGGWALQQARDVPANVTGANLGLSPHRNNKYRVRAFNANGVSAWSNWAKLP
jgi:hypothetical protein